MLNRKVILTTKRLWLHEITIDEAQDLFELNNDPNAIKYTVDPPFASIQHAESFILKYIKITPPGTGRWVVRLRSNDEFIGWCGLKLHDNGNVDLGFRLLQRHWNKGYATEASMGCLKYGFSKMGLSTIIGRVMHGNQASIRVLEKVGMKYWKDILCDEHPAKCFIIEK